jgi:hypothetical protein
MQPPSDATILGIAASPDGFRLRQFRDWRDQKIARSVARLCAAGKLERVSVTKEYAVFRAVKEAKL